MVIQNDEPLFIIVDLFCGAGGTTTGFADAVLPTDKYSKYYVGPDFCNTGFHKIAQVIACVNHDPIAIKSHWANHPEVVHFEEDIRTLDLAKLIELVKEYRRRYPKALLILWASLECTNFSKAKGGQPRDADSRTLANHLFRYVEAIDPDYIQIENVVEFMSWGPLRIKAKKTAKDRCYLQIGRDKKTGKKIYLYEPESKKNGQDYLRWRREMCAYGYNEDWTELNSANFGAYTSRNRLFGVFAKPGLPICFPHATHTKNPDKHSLFDNLEKWKAVKEKLDFSDEGESIFTDLYKKTYKKAVSYLSGKTKKKSKKDRYICVFPSSLHNPLFGMEPKLIIKKYQVDQLDKLVEEYKIKYGIDEVAYYRHDPLSDKTLERIYAGLLKYVANGDKSFISKYFSGKPKGKVNSVNNPAPTITTFGGSSLIQVSNIPVNGPAGAITTKDHHALVQGSFSNDKLYLAKCQFITQRNTGEAKSKVVDINGPARTLTATGGNQDLVSPQFLLKYNSTNQKTGKHVPPSVDDPAPVISTWGGLGLINPQFLDVIYGNGTPSGVDIPAPTIRTKDGLALVQPQYLSIQNQSIESPAGTIMPSDKHSLIQCSPFIMPTNYDNQPKSIDDPLQTITADRHHHYIVNPSHGGHTSSTNAPCPVIVARQDKAPLYLVQAETGAACILLFDSDSDVMGRIKYFMSLYGLVDIKMRMLRVKELLSIQGFPEWYKLEGNQSYQKKFIGNSVVPLVVKRWTEALAVRLIETMYKKQVA